MFQIPSDGSGSFFLSFRICIKGIHKARITVALLHDYTSVRFSPGTAISE